MVSRLSIIKFRVGVSVSVCTFCSNKKPLIKGLRSGLGSTYKELGFIC
jgi:hypothetical protein